MILSSLRDMAVREGLTGNNAFEQKRVKWVISLDQDGHFLGLMDTLSDTVGISPKKKPLAKIMWIPRQLVRTGIHPPAYFLVDKSEYVLGIEPNGERVIAELENRRGLFLKQMQAASAASGSPDLQAAVKFLSSEEERENCVVELKKRGYASGDLFTFKIEGQLLNTDANVRAYCNSLLRVGAGKPTEGARQCLICGEVRDPVRLHDQISGLGDDRCALVSFNKGKDAFEKYSLAGNDNAPICKPCMISYVEALRRCLSDGYLRPDDSNETLSKQCVKLTDDTTAIFWAGVESGVLDVLPHLGDRPADVKAALESPWKGQRHGSLETERFHCLIITGARGRAIVRGLHTGTLGGLIESLHRYFDCLGIPGIKPEEPMPICRLLRSLARQPKPPARPVDPPSGLAKDLFLAAVLGHQLPRRVLSEIVARNVAEQKVTPERAALLHLYFELQSNPEKLPMSLDVNNPDPAYLLGRLLAVLEAIQYQAQGVLNKNVVNRFYSAAATRPGSVFPRMLELTQHHLAKLPTGSRTFRQKQLGEVVNELIAFSPMQTLEEQGRFGLGYYHQRHANFQKAVPVDAANTDINESTNEEGAE